MKATNIYFTGKKGKQIRHINFLWELEAEQIAEMWQDTLLKNKNTEEKVVPRAFSLL